MILQELYRCEDKRSIKIQSSFSQDSEGKGSVCNKEVIKSKIGEKYKALARCLGEI